MSTLSIRVDDLAKQYRIGERQERYRLLRDSIARGVKQPFIRLASAMRGESALASRSTVWALRGISFEVEQGEVVGVIGHNGSGKTTLLKLLSRITEPTRGRAEIHGRVGSLLEVGTGFHPELTGRENVYLNGAILGMKRAEIEQKFDRIVEFAEIGDFIDTTVKFYSSGMYVRLAFAVAAHLEPEVLLVDEVLAVGDAAFQRKCIASIRESTEGGRTALVVSHNMAFVQSLCSRAILLDHGRLVADGPSDDVIGTYHRSLGGAAYAASEEHSKKPIHIAAVEVRDRRGHTTQEVPCGEGLSVRIRIHLDPGTQLARPWIGVRLYSWHGQLLSHLANREAGFELPQLDASATVVCDVPHLNLLPGEYHLGVIVADVTEGVQDRVENAVPLTVTRADVHGSGLVPSPEHGTVFFSSRWRVEAATEERDELAARADAAGEAR